MTDRLKHHPSRRDPRDKRLRVMARARYVGTVLSAFPYQNGASRRTVIRLRVTVPPNLGHQIVNIDVSTFSKYCHLLRDFNDFSELSTKDARRFGTWIKGKKVRVLLTHYEWHKKSEVLQNWAGDLMEVIQDD